MRSLFAAVLLLATTASFGNAQGYYQNQVRRNPVTGRYEIVRSGGDFRSAVPYRDSRDGRNFQGGEFNPYSGTAAQSQMRRNPVTGRVDVANEYYNPWTGARMVTQTRFNPFTRRYETVQRVLPPSRLPAEDEVPALEVPEENPAAPEDNGRVQPRVIETYPAENDPLPVPPVD